MEPWNSSVGRERQQEVAMDQTDLILRRLVEELQRRKGFSTPHEAARWLVYEHPWAEVTGVREPVLRRLQELLLKEDFAPEELYDFLKDKPIVGGHFSARAQLKDFLGRPESKGLIQALIGGGERPPDAETINRFLDQAVDLGFRTRRGRPDRSNAALLASVLLAAVYPDRFVDFRNIHWSRAADFFGWGEKPSWDYGEALIWAGKAAQRVAKTPTYQRYFAPIAPDIPANWVIGGLVYLLAKPEGDPDFREAVEAIRGIIRDRPHSGGDGTMITPAEVWDVLQHHNPQVILQGPPGSGKTYLAERVVQYVAGTLDIARYRLAELGDEIPDDLPVIWEVVQFHPSYAYEDFVRGLVTRPRREGVVFEVEDRILARAAAVAERCPQTPVILILDEINRADLARVLGELIYALERDRRGEPVRAQYGVGDPPDHTLRLPKNLYLIGTMNTADRSIALVDYAIRRRFSFLSVLPQVEVVEAFYQDPRQHEGRPEFADRLGPRVTALYRAVYELFNGLQDADDIRIGHSYFLVKGNRDGEMLSLREWADAVAFRFAFEVVPMIAEYRKERRLHDGRGEIEVEGQRFSLSLNRQRDTRVAVRDWLASE